MSPELLEILRPLAFIALGFVLYFLTVGRR